MTYATSGDSPPTNSAAPSSPTTGSKTRGSQIPEASGGRLGFAALFDASITLGSAIAVAMSTYDPTDLLFPVIVLATFLGVSFVNHVVGTWFFQCSLGKFLWALRVIRWQTGGHPGFWRPIGRWLIGFIMLIVMVMAEELDTVGQACGLRTVRRRDLRASSPQRHVPSARQPT